MKLLNDFFALRKQIYEYFGYVEDWCVIPLDDATPYYWRLYGAGPGQVRFAETPEKLDDPELNYYSNEIYTNRFLPKWVYRGPEYTMVVVDTRTDGNKFLQIFDNKNERPEVSKNPGIKLKQGDTHE